MEVVNNFGGTIDIVPEVVAEQVEKLSKEIEKFQELSESYMTISKKLDSWNSKNKVELEQQIENSKPAFKEAIDVIASYRDVAGKTVALMNETERLIGQSLNQNTMA